MAVVSLLEELAHLKKISDFRRKGFVYTLEAVIAATLFMTIILVVLPGIQDQSLDRGLQESVHASMESLDMAGELEAGMSASEIEAELDPYIPPGISYSVKLSELDTETRRFNAPEEFSFSEEGDRAELKLWIDYADDLTVTFQDETIVENHDSPDYIQGELSGADGDLSFTGDGEGRFDFDVYTSSGETPDTENLRSVNYIISGEKITEIQVFLWQE